MVALFSMLGAACGLVFAWRGEASMALPVVGVLAVHAGSVGAGAWVGGRRVPRLGWLVGTLVALGYVGAQWGIAYLGFDRGVSAVWAWLAPSCLAVGWISGSLAVAGRRA
jgi:hypothetical protein